MRKIIIMSTFLLSLSTVLCQENYTINGETLALKTEVQGTLDLLWNVFGNEFRYFVRTNDGTITELKNTRSDAKTYLEEYKTILSQLTKDTDMSIEKLNFTRYSLRNFIDTYNSKVDSTYTSKISKPNIRFRLGFFGGITNNPFVSNTENKKTPLIGAELEIYGATSPSRHSGFFQIRHAFESDDFQYSTTELSLGYRYRFINAEKFNMYGQVKFATLNFTNATLLDENEMSLWISETAFDIPLIFGLGADIKVSKNSYITLIYSELFAVFLDNQDNFSTDISIGYKFDL